MRKILTRAHPRGTPTAGVPGRFARAGIVLWLGLGLGPGCVSRRMLVLENEVMRGRVTALEQQLAELERVSPPPDYVREIDLDVLARFIDQAGYRFRREDAGGGILRIPFQGSEAKFDITVQYFASAKVVFIATSDYIDLDDAQGTESLALLLVEMATLNYDLLIGKFQLNPENGQIALSAEIFVRDGLTYGAFVETLERITQTADGRYPTLKRAAEGAGM